MRNDYRYRLSVVFLTALLLAGLSGCGGASEPARFYVLSTPSGLKQDIKKTAKLTDLTIGVGPISLPAHLDRPQIITKSSRHKLNLAEFDHWAEPLKNNFTRVLTENLTILLDTDNIRMFPWRNSITLKYQLTAEVARFDTAPNGESVLVVRWNLYGKKGRKLLFTKRSIFRQRLRGTGFESTVAAMSNNLAEMSREVATAISNLSK